MLFVALYRSINAYLILYRGETRTQHEEITSRFFSVTHHLFSSKSSRKARADAVSARAKVKVNNQRVQ